MASNDSKILTKEEAITEAQEKVKQAISEVLQRHSINLVENVYQESGVVYVTAKLYPPADTIKIELDIKPPEPKSRFHDFPEE